MRKLPKRLLNLLIGLIITVVTIEVAAYLSLLVLGQNSKTFDDIFYGNDNLFVRGDCNYEDTLYPHPYLAFAHNTRCFKLNNIGLLGSDVEPAPRSGMVRIGIFGGSVAAQFAAFSETSVLEDLLNRCYSGGGSATYKIGNFADGAWKQPQQVIALSLYKNFVDVAVSIEGFNEHYGYDGSLDLAVPAGSFETVNPALQRYRTMRLVFGSLHVNSDSLLARSNAYKFLVLGVRKIAERVMTKQRPNNKWQYQWAWTLPAGMDNHSWFEARYAGFVRDFDAVAKAANIPSVIVLQPVPILKKHLTAEEAAVVTYTGYEEAYGQIAKLLAANALNFLDLSALFADEQVTIFADNVHFPLGGENYPIGATRMAERIAQYLGDLGILKHANACQ